MDERLGHLVRNQGEEVWISLRTLGGIQEIELRVYERRTAAKGEPSPGTERISIPADMVPALIKTLVEAQDALVARGLLYAPATAKITKMERGDAVGLGTDERPKAQPARQHPRVPLNVRGECRLLDKKDFWPGKPVVGEVLNVSTGGAQVLLPQRFPRFAQVELFMVADGMVFRGRAEVAGADAGTQVGASGSFRHSLRWLGLEAQAKDVLSKLVAPHAQKPDAS
ncbi:MAG: hypothetical protein EHM71_03505 [Zetaproteobacteria bacterium]|nr:MAG: hypothetical protein EHM71_03505 [Zetaproteobacteria bacterium]